MQAWDGPQNPSLHTVSSEKPEFDLPFCGLLVINLKCHLKSPLQNPGYTAITVQVQILWFARHFVLCSRRIVPGGRLLIVSVSGWAFALNFLGDSDRFSSLSPFRVSQYFRRCQYLLTSVRRIDLPLRHIHGRLFFSRWPCCSAVQPSSPSSSIVTSVSSVFGCGQSWPQPQGSSCCWFCTAPCTGTGERILTIHTNLLTSNPYVCMCSSVGRNVKRVCLLIITRYIHIEIEFKTYLDLIT